MRNLKRLLPEYPSTPHLTEGVLPNVNVDITEKLDGAQCGMALIDDHPVIRNRKHILKKGFRKETSAAKMQFASVWSWFYENLEKFDALGGGYSVYGEWLVALHGIRYDKLPDSFIAYDLYDQEAGQFVATHKARPLLEEAGFIVVPLLYNGPMPNLDQIVELCNKPSAFSSLDDREGVYLKINDEKHVINRYKMVRPDYIQGSRWSIRTITKNKYEK